MKTALALAAFSLITYAAFGRLDAAENCLNDAWPIEKILSSNRAHVGKPEYGRLWEKIIKAEDGVTLVYMQFEAYSYAAEFVFVDGCLATSSTNLDGAALLEMIGRTTRAEAFPPETAL
jgi:hypothetical protein